MRRVGAGLLVLGMVMLLPAVAFAQATITGIVKDASGAVLPGVTVEASSPVLIEKVRTAVSDGTGQYRIVDLRAGTYTVTFSLTGFSSVKRDGIELSGSFTAVINADLKVGAVAETITVIAETPVVDTQSVRRQTTISNDLISAIPAARGYAGLMQLIPNTVVQAGSSSDVQVVPQMVVFGSAGGRSNEGRLQVDGLSVGSAFNGAGVSAYHADVTNAAEITMTTSGGLGEAEVGGPSLNIVPKTGGNSLKGSLYLSGVSSGMIGSNYSQELKDRGLLAAPGSYESIYDFNGAVGGPLLKDRIWYFGQARNEGFKQSVTGMFANVNAGDASSWLYKADPNRQAKLAASFLTTSLRLTTQVTPRNKIGLFWDEQKPCEGAAFQGAPDSVDACRRSGNDEIVAGGVAPTPSASATFAPETAAYRDNHQRVQQVTWQSPATNRLLFDAGFGGYQSRYGGKLMPGSPAGDLIRITEQCATSCANNGNIPGLTYRSPNYSSSKNEQFNWRAAASWVNGAQSMKFGYQGGYLVDRRRNFSNPQELAYRTQNGRPDQITETIDRFGVEQRVRYHAFYAQDQWTTGRLTLQGALRFDRATSFFPEQTVGGVPFLPAVTTFPETPGVDAYKDLTPRAGLAYDLFGNGKTALKFNFGRYLEAAQNGGLFSASNPTSRLQTTATRTWTDANNNYTVDCDLLNAGAQDLRAGGGDFCAALTNTAFGRSVFDTTQDPALFSGWGIRTGDWQWGASVQQQVAPRVSVELSYLRRWLVNFITTDNRAIAAGDMDPFFISAPSDSRLPGGGGYQVAGPLYNVNPSKSSVAADNFVTLANNYGDYTQKSNAIALNISARPRNGLMLQGGLSTAQTLVDYCAVRAAIPEWTVILAQGPTNPYCNTNTGWVTRYTALGSYTIPHIDVLVAGTMRSDQGGALAANWAAPNSVIAPSLGRNLSNNAPTATVNLIQPGTLYGDRVNEFDVRLAKILRFGRTRTNVGIDVYNVFNNAPVLTYNQTFVLPSATNPNGSWLAPNSVLQARFVKISAQIDF